MNQDVMVPMAIMALAAVAAAALTARPALKTIRNRSRGPLLPGLLLLLLPALACSGDGAPGASSGAEAVEAAETQVIPGEALNITEPSDRIAQISDIAIAADGTVWVLNTTAPFFMAMSEEGEVLSYRGSRGEGPGEFSRPSNLLRVGPASHLWVYDSRARRLTRIDGGEGRRPKSSSCHGAPARSSTGTTPGMLGPACGSLEGRMVSSSRIRRRISIDRSGCGISKSPT